MPGLPPGNGITRPRLHRIFQSHTLDSGADVRTGVTFTRIDDDDDRVEVEFTDGETRSYDLVVGADGLHSQVRETVFGAELKPTYTGQVCWRYNLPRIEGLDKIWVYIGATGTAGFVPARRGPDVHAHDREAARGRADAGSRARGWPPSTASVWPSSAAPVAAHRELIVDDDAVVYRPVENVLMPPPWHRGRVVLIGDAAHGTSPHCGQGAAQAIEDAVVLREELGSDRPLVEALEAFSRGGSSAAR